MLTVASSISGRKFKLGSNMWRVDKISNVRYSASINRSPKNMKDIKKCKWGSVMWRDNKFSNVSYSASINPSRNNNKNTSPSSTYNVIPQPRKMVSENETREFMSLFPSVVKNLTEPYKAIPDVAERYAKVLEYNVPNHQQASGLAVVSAYKMLESAENLTPRNVRLANILGWCVDLLLCSYQINDDIMDSSEIRRGIPCWYRNEGVGRQSVNDAVLIENGPYLLLQNYFSDHRCYIPCVQWLHEVTVKTSLGQSLDTMNRLNGKPNLQAFTFNRIRNLAKYKGAYPEYLLPVKLAMYFAGKFEAHLHQQVQNVLIELGDYFTAQNDILDCYGDPSITGKLGTDIREGKCTWLVATALQRATGTQRQLLNEHYGNSEPESELKVRNLYEELNILDTFLAYEKDSFNTICRRIQQMSKGLPQELFFKVVNTTYGQY